MTIFLLARVRAASVFDGYGSCGAAAILVRGAKLVGDVGNRNTVYLISKKFCRIAGTSIASAYPVSVSWRGAQLRYRKRRNLIRGSRASPRNEAPQRVVALGPSP